MNDTFTRLEDIDKAMRETCPTEINPAKSLSQKLYGRLPLIYGAGITAEVAHRWKTQINENSKTMCYYELFSELNHNAVVGYRFPQDLLLKRWFCYWIPICCMKEFASGTQ